MPQRARRIAQIGIGIQFAALIRCLGELFRLKFYAIEKLTPAHLEPFIVGALVSAVFALAGILFYFSEKFRLTAMVAALNVVILFVLRYMLL